MTDIPKIPGYVIQSLLGVGGMARVFLGIQEKLNRKVAIKVLNPSVIKDQSISQRFLLEAKTAANLYHSGIVSIFDVGCTDDFHYIIMEYLEDNLKQRIYSENHRRLSLKSGFHLVMRIADALDYAHREGVIHRDIKPDNIMFRKDQTPVLVDFGIARLMDSDVNVTQTGMSVGTPHYMSPEQCMAEKIDGRSDFYSLGVVLFELLAHDKPYKAESHMAIALQHLREPIPRLPAEFLMYQSIIDKMMAKKREDRVQNGKEVIALLAAFLKNPVEAEKIQSGPVPAMVEKNEVQTDPPSTAAQTRDRSDILKRISIIISLTVISLTAILYFFIAGPGSETEQSPLNGNKNRSDRLATIKKGREESTRVQEAIKAPDVQPPATENSDMVGAKKKEIIKVKSPTGETSRPQTIKKNIIKAAPVVHLRSEYQLLDHEGVGKMIVVHNFAESSFNPRGGKSGNTSVLREIQGDSVVEDTRLGLMWQRDGSEKAMKMKKVVMWIDDLNRKGFAGFSDWRLPTLEEAASLLYKTKNGDGLYISPLFSSVQDKIWTGDLFSRETNWTVRLDAGVVFTYPPNNALFVRLVRSMK